MDPPDNSNCFKNFLLGLAMGFTESDCSRYAIFEKGQPNLSLFFVKENRVVILFINKAQIVSDDEAKAAFLQQKVVSLRNSLYLAVTVEFDQRSTPTLKTTVSGAFNLHCLNQESFLYKEIEPLKFIQKDDVTHEYDLAHEKVAGELYDFGNKGLYEVIELESDLQALWQGGLLESGEVQVYTESNHATGRQADLVIKGKNNLMVW